jgi:hypothetical protein
MNDRNTRHKMPKNTDANTKTDRAKTRDKTTYWIISRRPQKMQNTL